MAGLNPPLNRTADGLPTSRFRPPRILMSWEDWLTFSAALVAFLSIAISIQHAHWVRNMPALVPTAVAGLLIGMIAARTRTKALFIHPVALVLGIAVVVLVVQTYADGATIADRIADFRMRMREWIDVVRSGDISNDNLPFVTLVHSVTFLCSYLAAWSIYRWRNPWIAIIPGGMVLLANISFMKGQPSGAFIVFLFGAMVLVARLHLQRSQLRWIRQGVEYPDWISISAIQLTLFSAAGLIVAAWLMPLGGQSGPFESVVDTLIKPATSHTDTLVRLFHNVDSQKGTSLHSFGDVLAVNGHVKLGTRAVLEVNSASPGVIRAQSYEEYTGNGWKTTSRAETKVDAKDIAVSGDAGEYQKRKVSVLGITVLDSENTVLTPGTPIGTNLPTTIETPKGVTGEIERMVSRKSLGENDSYNSIGSESVATPDDLATAGENYPGWVANRYLQLPKSLPQSVRDEARRVTAEASAETPYAKAAAIEKYLRAFPYDPDVDPAPAGEDTVAFFLFKLHRGYFDYQASAMAVMLRSLGVPARVTVGYVLDPETAQGTKYTVSKKDAYTWVEVFFPTYGWVNFNPTSTKLADQASGFGSLLSGSGGLTEPNLQDLFGDTFENPQPDGGIAPVKDALGQDATVHSDPPWLLIWSLVAALVVFALSAFGARIAWNRGMTGLEPRAQAWTKTQRLARWARIGPKQSETPREWSRRMGGAVGLDNEARTLSDAYEEARYGRPDLRRIDDDETTSAYRRLRGALAGRVFRRRSR